MYTAIDKLELELSSSCNAWCPVCPRNLQSGTGIYQNPHADLNNHMTVEDIDNILSVQTTPRVSIDCIGTVGDPLANKNIVDLVARIVELKPQARLQLHTNGSLRTPEVFRQLAELMPYGKQRKIVFSIDGDEETNHLYRIGVQWERVMENARAFCDAGGFAEWKYILFHHNLESVVTAKRLAREIGFANFRFSENQSPHEMVDRHVATPPTLHTHAPEEYDDDEDYSNPPQGEIEPECINDQYVHIRADGEVYPCCMTAAGMYDVSSFVRQDTAAFIQPGWNNIRTRKFTDILADSNWQRIQSSFSSCWTCKHSCSEDNEKLNKNQ